MSKNANFGLFCGVASYIMWGCFPIYFKLLEHINPFEVVLHRIVWAFIFLLIAVKILKKDRNLIRFFRIKKVVLTLFVTGFLISSNWGIYIYAVTNNQILECALGYFINPLMSILLGVIFLKEKPTMAVKISIFLVVVAILVQIFSIGKIPIISLILPASFAFYGLIRKRVQIPAIEGLFIETMLIFPFAFFGLFIFAKNGIMDFKTNLDGFLLFFSGLVTIIPLLTFNIAVTKLKLTTIGFLQYISPTLAIVLAVYYGESLSFDKILSFAIIWVAIFIVSVSNLKRRKIER